MSNALSEEKKQQVIALGRLGWSLRKIERETGVRRETAGAYLRAAGIAVRIPRAWGRPVPAKPANEVTPDLSEAKPANEVTPDFVGLLSQPPSSPAGRVSACEPYRDLIEEKLSRGRNAKAIWQDLVTDHGYPGDYQTVKRFVRRLGGSKLPQAAGIILTEPGEEAQVDYGSGPLVRDPQTGKYRRTRLFVLTLGYSRKSVRLLVWRSSTRVWAELHEKAFRRLGGSPRVIILDFVPGNKIEIMCRFPLCVLQPRNVVVGGGRTSWGPHNDHSELSHFINSSSFCHPAVVRGVSKLLMGGKQAATAACFVRKVISA
jgi:hypothetical protein